MAKAIKIKGMNEILFYSAIFDFTAAEFINKLGEIPKDQDVTVRLNSPGGSVFAGWGIIAALQERTGRNILKVDGNASSMAFFMVPFFDEVQALDVTNFMIHRADAYIENEDDQKWLDEINKTLRSKLEKRIDPDSFAEVTGVTFDEIYKGETRREIWITAKQAKKLGLVDKVVRLEPREIEAINKNLVAFSKFDSAETVEQPQGSEQEKGKININLTQKKMTRQELNAQAPDLVAAILAEGQEIERKRVRTILKFSHIDAKVCNEMITDGKEPDSEFFADMQLKAISQKQLDAIKEETKEEIKIDPTAENTAPEIVEDPEKLKYRKTLRASAGLKDEEGK